jgi:NTE family protein
LRVTGSIGRENELSFDFYQPIDRQANWFVEPTVYMNRRQFSYWENDVNLAELKISGWGASLGLGRNLSTSDRIRLDYEFARADADVSKGDLGFPLDDEVRIGELVLEYHHDSLDSFWFPSSGMFHRWAYLYAADELGAAFDYQQALGNGSFAWSRGKNNFALNYAAGYSFDDAAPFESWFRIGGFGRLSGLAPDQLSGRHAALGTLVYYHTLTDVKFAKTYAGATLEAGNVWNYSSDIALDDLRYSASLFVGAETPIGPVYFAVGHSDNGDSAAYFYVGNPFRINRFD